MKRIILVRHGESTENVAISEGKSYDKNNIILTDKGKLQAKITGKYLSKVFGKFDKVYSSPVNRCIQTTNIIIKQIEYKKNPIIDVLLGELGHNNSKVDGMSKEERDKILNNIKLNNLPREHIFKNIKSYRDLEDKIKKTINPYDKLKLTQIYPSIEKKYLDVRPNSEQVKYNLIKFFKKIKETKDNNILIITHGMCINILEKIICNIDITNKEISFIDSRGNCCIVCLGFENNKYSLVSPGNIKHLENKI